MTKPFPSMGYVLLVVLTLLFSACGTSELSGTGGTSTPTEETSLLPTTSTQPTVVPTPAILNAQQIAQKLKPSVVMIRATFPETPVSSAGIGSGTGIVFTDDGYIVTAAHVVAGASAVTIAASGSSHERPARIIGTSICDDIAILKAENTTDLTPAAFGESHALTVGEDVVAIGYPLGEALGVDFSITRGIISKLDASIAPYESMIQTDASINPGNSGGPLANQRGEVIGLNTLSAGKNINFAISIDLAKDVISELKEGRNRNWIGLNLDPNEYADYFGTDHGLVVVGVSSGSSASAIKIQPADLLLKLEGVDINTSADVCKILRSHSNGDQLKIELLRITNAERQLLAGEVAIDNPKAGNPLELVAVDAQQSGNTGGSTSGGNNMAQIGYNFDSDNGEWYTGTSEGVSATVHDGYYSIILQSANGYYLSPLYGTESVDMAIGADVGIQGNARAGIALRYSENDTTKSYYACWIDGSTNYGCFVSIDNQWTTLAESTSSSAIIPAQVNKLVLAAVGDKVRFIINGKDIATFTDSRIARGAPALYLENFDTVAGAAFDNVTIILPK